MRNTLRSLVSILMILVILQTSSAFAARSAATGGGAGAGRFGAGLMIGTIDAITGKYVLSNRNAIDFGLAFVPSPWTVLYADYLINFPGMFGGATQFARQTTGYVGLGGGLGFWSRANDCYRYYCGTTYAGSSTGLFARAFFGAEWFPGQPPLGVFAEIGPTIGLVPGFGGVIDLGIGLRYFF